MKQPQQSKRLKNQQAAKASQTKTLKGLTFEFEGCRRSSGTAVCTYYITSIKGDFDTRIDARGGFSHYPASFSYDNLGNAVKASYITLANCSDEKECRMTLIEGIRTKSTLSFQVAEDATSLSKLLITGVLDNRF